MGTMRASLEDRLRAIEDELAIPALAARFVERDAGIEA